MKRALLIGNQKYINMETLYTPQNDVDQLKKIFIILGFSVTSYIDTSKEIMVDVIIDFINSIIDGDEVVFFFSGHGYSFSGHNYITPVDW